MIRHSTQTHLKRQMHNTQHSDTAVLNIWIYNKLTQLYLVVHRCITSG